MSIAVLPLYQSGVLFSKVNNYYLKQPNIFRNFFFINRNEGITNGLAKERLDEQAMGIYNAIELWNKG